MTPNPFFGVTMHAVGGLAAGSFYIPFRKVQRWAWESYWLIQGLLAWIVMPTLVSLLTVPSLGAVLAAVEPAVAARVYLYGALWGVGGLTFGLSMRYLGMSLGYAVALGFCAAFGTLVPALQRGRLPGMFTTAAGLAVLAGVAVCLAGICVCGYAGIRKEAELTDEQKRATIHEFALAKGFSVAILAGVMSACMALAFDAGEPIAEAASQAGAAVFQHNPIYILAMAGGFTTNFLWCLFLNLRNRSLRDYVAGAPGLLAANYVLAGLAGVIWYGQFFFYGMGSALLGGQYKFSSWTIHMAFIIVFSNLWGLRFKEWKGVSGQTLGLVWVGILALILSTVVIGWGNYLAAETPAQPRRQKLTHAGSSKGLGIGDWGLGIRD